MSLLCISLWVGGAILGLAPGTLHRAGEVDSGVSFIANLKSGIYMLFEQVAFIALLIVLFCSIFISTIRKSLRENKIEFALLLVSIIFAILLHTTAQSFGGIQVFSFLILLSIINNILPNIKSSKAVYTLFFILLSFFCIHQSMIVADDYRLEKFNHTIVTDYKNSSDGIVICNPEPINELTSKWTYNFMDYVHPSALGYDWFVHTIMLAHGREDKKLILLTNQEYSALGDSIRGEGSVKFFVAGAYNFIPVQPNSDTDSINITYRFSPTASIVNNILLKINPSISFVHNKKLGLSNLNKTQLSDSEYYYICSEANHKVLSIDKIDK